MIYYTYAYLREDRTPYYLGKGENDSIREKFCVDSPGIVWNLGRLYKPRDFNGQFV